MQTSLDQGDGTRDLGRIERITRSYPYLQGLKVVPIGLFMLGVVLVGSSWWPWNAPVTKLVPLGLVLSGSVGLMWWAARYYEGRFGRVAPTREQLRRDAKGTGLAAVAVAAGVLIDASLAPPVSASAIALGASLLWYWTWSGGPRWYQRVAAAAFAVVAVLPIAGDALDVGMIEPGEPIVNLVLLVAGATFIVTGLMDHAYLVRELGPSTEPRHAESR
jgi:hypothetical protein